MGQSGKLPDCPDRLFPLSMPFLVPHQVPGQCIDHPYGETGIADSDSFNEIEELADFHGFQSFRFSQIRPSFFFSLWILAPLSSWSVCVRASRALSYCTWAVFTFSICSWYFSPYINWSRYYGCLNLRIALFSASRTRSWLFPSFSPAARRARHS